MVELEESRSSSWAHFACRVGDWVKFGMLRHCEGEKRQLGVASETQGKLLSLQTWWLSHFILCLPSSLTLPFSGNTAIFPVMASPSSPGQGCWVVVR